jgi:hypothetical protein
MKRRKTDEQLYSKRTSLERSLYTLNEPLKRRSNNSKSNPTFRFSTFCHFKFLNSRKMKTSYINPYK